MTRFQYFFIFLLCLNLYASNDFVKAGKAFNVDARILWAIAYKESRFNPKAINTTNKNGSYDIGIMQINSSHLKWLERDFKINEQDLFNPSVNIYIGAMILKKCFDKHKVTQNAITCYNGRIINNPYGKEVLDLIKEAESEYKKQRAQQRMKEYFKLEKQRVFVKQIK